MSKKAVVVLIVVLFLVMAVAAAYAEGTRIKVESYKIAMTASPNVINGEAYVPVRPVLEALGWKLEWNPADRSFTGRNGEKEIAFKIGSTDASINGERIILDSPPILINGFAYMQNSFIAKQFGVKIRWNKKENLIILSADDTSNVRISGEGNIVIAGNGIIVNIFEPYGIDTAYDMLDHGDRLLDDNDPAGALSVYQGILENILQEESPDVYAHVRNNMGNAYSLLAEIRDMKNNTLLAKDSYREALKIYTAAPKAMKYAITLNNLGNAYKALAEATGNRNNLIVAIDSYKEAIGFPWPESYKLEYASVQYNMGLAYLGLGREKKAEERLQEARDVWEGYLKTCGEGEESVEQAIAQFNLGNTYKALASIKNPQENLSKAEAAYDKALEVRTVESYPLDYAGIHVCLGEILKMSAMAGEDQDKLKKAAGEYLESLKVYTPDRYPIYTAKANFELGGIYMLLGGEYRQCALQVFKEALKVFTASDYPAYNRLATDGINQLDR